MQLRYDSYQLILSINRRRRHRHEYPDLEYLVALSEHNHFRRAADACHVSQPTLSGQIRKLEDELGVMLLERTSRKVLFTQQGMLLVDQAYGPFCGK